MKNVAKRIISISMVIVMMLSIAVMFSGCDLDIYHHIGNYKFPSEYGLPSIEVYEGIYSYKLVLDVDDSVEEKCAYFLHPDTNREMTLRAIYDDGSYWQYKISRFKGNIGEDDSVLYVEVTVGYNESLKLEPASFFTYTYKF